MPYLKSQLHIPFLQSLDNFAQNIIQITAKANDKTTNLSFKQLQN